MASILGQLDKPVPECQTILVFTAGRDDEVVKVTAVSLHFNGHFPGGPGLAGTRCPFWILSKQDDGGGGDSWSYKTCKAPAKLSPSTNQHPVFTGRMPFLSPNQQCHCTEGDGCNTIIGANHLHLFPTNSSPLAYRHSGYYRPDSLATKNVKALKPN